MAWVINITGATLGSKRDCREVISPIIYFLVLLLLPVLPSLFKNKGLATRCKDEVSDGNDRPDMPPSGILVIYTQHPNEANPAPDKHADAEPGVDLQSFPRQDAGRRPLISICPISPR